MRLRWLVALAAILALVLGSSVLAGETRPAGGDPDIWERARTATPTQTVKSVFAEANPTVTIDLGVVKVKVTRQEGSERLRSDISKLPSISVREKSSR